MSGVFRDRVEQGVYAVRAAARVPGEIHPLTVPSEGAPAGCAAFIAARPAGRPLRPCQGESG